MGIISSTLHKPFKISILQHSPLFVPLTIVVHTYYARPFGPNHGVGRLSEEFIPSEQIGIHRCLLHFRNSVLSHTDANHADVADRPMHDVVYSFAGDHNKFTTSAPQLNIESYRDVLSHCATMALIFRSKIIELEQKHHELLPACEGDFLMTLDDSLDLFIPHTLPVQGTLHYS